METLGNPYLNIPIVHLSVVEATEPKVVNPGNRDQVPTRIHIKQVRVRFIFGEIYMTNLIHVTNSMDDHACRA